MCFSAEASLGVSLALLPAGAYCAEAAWRKDRRYLLLAIVPIVFGMQQLCEAMVWQELALEDPVATRIAALAYLGFALAFWPVWVPVAMAAIERGGRRWLVFSPLAALGLLVSTMYFLPLVIDGGCGLNPVVVGHSIRYDLSAVPAMNSVWWWVWLLLYLLAVSAPLFLSRERELRPLGVALIIAGALSYALFEYAFASVWCFFAAALSLYLLRVFALLPDQPSGIPAPSPLPAASN